MLENADANGSPSQNDECNNNSASDYLQRAAQACAAGDAVLGLHLYLAAFEKGSQGVYAPDDEAIDGLYEAWELACTLKERSLAEYVFEKIEPYLTADEVGQYADKLQRLALDKLEEFGLSRDDLEEMTDMISQDFLGFDPGHMLKVEHVTLPNNLGGAVFSRNMAQSARAAGTSPEKRADASRDANNGTAQSDAAEIIEPSSGKPGSEAAAQSGSLSERMTELSQAIQAAENNTEINERDGAGSQAFTSTLENITFAELVGYDETVTFMRNFGVGMQDDEEFQSLVALLNTRHGLDRMPAADAMLFRAPAREDAHRFMIAALGELGLPAIRMQMEENMQGMPVLCVMAQAGNTPKLGTSKNTFEGPGVLILEDLDLWISPMADMGEDMGGLLFSSLSRGAREAINLIRSAVENPDVYVMASSSQNVEIDSFFFDLLEPLSVIDIDNPTELERSAVWSEIARTHPSLQDVDHEGLVRLSAGMPRFDIYMAAREAIEDAYKASLVSHDYCPVTTDSLLEKLAAYQPLDSEEYRALEDAVVQDFRLELEHIDDLLKGTED